jgi:hypothetical protein
VNKKKGDQSVHSNTLKIVLLSVAAFLAHSQASATEWDITERRLRKLESEMLAAHVTLDFTTLAHMYADEYTYISNDGTMLTKSQVVEIVKTASFRVDSIPVSNSRVRMYGTTAVITGVRKFYRAGKLLATARYTEVWVNRNKRWQCVSGQLTPILEKK